MGLVCVIVDAGFFRRMATMKEDASGRRQRAVMATDADENGGEKLVHGSGGIVSLRAEQNSAR